MSNPFLVFIIQVLAIYFISKAVLNEMFYVLRLHLKQDRFVFILVSLFFLPGTILHELAHFFMAAILMLRVRDLKIFPEFKQNYIKLGSVLYEKKDVLRSILVGIAPLFVAFLFFWVIAKFEFFPGKNIAINMLLSYLIFTVSSTMFSSKQDLIDAVFIIPLAIVMAGVIYIFDLKVEYIVQNKTLISGLLSFISIVNSYLLFSIIMNIVLFTLFKTYRIVLKR